MRSYICIALLLIAQAAAQAPAPAPLTLYQRPQNGDCVSQVRNGALNYFPAQLRISGSGSNPENQTTVSMSWRLLKNPKEGLQSFLECNLSTLIQVGIGLPFLAGDSSSGLQCHIL